MGELCALLSALCFATANVTIMRGAEPGAEDNGAFLSILMTTVIALVVWVYFGVRDGWPHINVGGLLWFACAGILTVFIGRVFLYASVQHLGAVRASAVKRLNPFFSVLLGVFVLGEPLTVGLSIGMLLIFASFGLLVRQSLRKAGQARAETGSPNLSMWGTLTNLGYFYGPISALAYATGYVARKQGLLHIPDGAFGTMTGSVVAAIVFVLAAHFVDSYRRAVWNVFATFNPWLFAAGGLSSVGQILNFVALNYSTISRVALINSMEAFLTIFLSVWVFRTREKLSATILMAAGLGVIGTAFVLWR